MPAPASMLDKLRLVCGAEEALLVGQAAEACRELGYTAYLVGGLVRDVLLEIPSLDFDVMVEEDACELAAELYRGWRRWFGDRPHPRKPVRYRHYRTAKLRFDHEIVPGITQLDFSTARSETYPVPGGKPVIEPGDLRSDLARRDFSMNALAVRLTGPQAGCLVDMFGGSEDIERGVIRVLHDGSFVDDPARLIRALRFASRFGFVMNPQTHALFDDACGSGALSTLPGARLFDELRKALEEPQPALVVERLLEAGLLAQAAAADRQRAAELLGQCILPERVRERVQRLPGIGKLKPN